jgi:lipopolysaccharide export system protein LptA
LRIDLRKQFVTLMLVVATACATSQPQVAQSSAGGGPHQSDRRITVTADRLVSDREAKTATFTGHVKVVRGSSTIEADRLTVVYAGNTPRSDAGLPGRSAIERVVAEGNVRIRSEDLTATTPKAVYSRFSQTIELLGAGTRVISGSNSISGPQILLHLEGERLTVSSGGDSRVKAVIEPSSKK